MKELREIHCFVKKKKKKGDILDFLGGPVVKSLPANAGDMGSVPGQGNLHMPQGNTARVPQLLKPTCLELVPYSKRSRHNEKPMHCR